jgi:hypothetical protein
MPRYKTLVALDHTADHCIYPAGTVVSLDHLDSGQVAILLKRGYVVEVKAETEVEVKTTK